MSDPSPRKRQIEADANDEEELFGSPDRSSPPSGSRQDIPSSPAMPFDEDDEDEEPEIRDEVEDLDEAEERMNEVDLFGDDMMNDYKESTEKDHYDPDDIDDEAQEELSIGEARRVNDLLNERDKRLGQNAAFLDDDDDGQEVERDQYGLPVQARRVRNQFDEDDLMGDLEDIDPLNEELSLESLADIKAQSVSEWVIQPTVARTIARELKSFLLEYNIQGRSVYGAKIRELGETNSESLEVSYKHLLDSKAILAMFLSLCPEEVLKIFDVVAMEATELHYPDYSQIHSEIHVRVADYTNILTLKDLRENNLNQLVRVSGVVTRRTGVFPQLKYVKFDCNKCNTVLGPYVQDSHKELSITYCPNCKSKSTFRMNTERTVYRNYQQLTIQEKPSNVTAGRLPRSKNVILTGDLTDTATPGQLVEITGIYRNTYDGRLNASNGFPVFATVIEANAVKKVEGRSSDSDEGLDSFQWTEEDEREFRRLASEKGIIDKIIASMAPSIYGHKDIKTAVAVSLFGGVQKNVNGKHSIRGDINVLLLGDPGVAKSQILKYVEKTAHRAVFATGQGASAVGLTASVKKDSITKEWTLEGGALVLADKGTCLIDEFDKMNDADRTSIHEAMEQQSISISKAGIVTSLKARCAVIAAANPIGGRYNSTLPLSQNVNLTEPILSRFDILCVVRDQVDPEVDERLANFVISSHMRSHPLSLEEEKNSSDEGEDEEGDQEMDDSPVRARHSSSARARSRKERISAANKAKEKEISPIPQNLLIKYIHYVRSKIHPKLSQADIDKVSRVYADLRHESITSGSFPITVRHLESILRIAESFAKMRMSEFVSSYDIDRAIRVTIESFIGAQKVSVRRQLQRNFMKYTLPNRA